MQSLTCGAPVARSLRVPLYWRESVLCLSADNHCEPNHALYLKIIDEINYDVASAWFWSVSSIVLNYIAYSNGRFQRFIANRVAFFRTHTSVSQWRFATGELNPADLLSRGS